MHEERTHASPTGRIGGKPQSNEQRVPKYVIADALAPNLQGHFTTTVSPPPSQFRTSFGKLTATERNYVDTAFNESVRKGRHPAEGPKSEEKQCISQPGNTKKQRQDGTPKCSIHSHWGMPRSIPMPGSETIEKERVWLATLVLACMTLGQGGRF